MTPKKAIEKNGATANLMQAAVGELDPAQPPKGALVPVMGINCHVVRVEVRAATKPASAEKRCGSIMLRLLSINRSRKFEVLEDKAAA